MAEILVVDDDTAMGLAFRQFLEGDGHTPLIVSNVEDAVKAVQEKSLDLVIMDIRMPGTNGLAGLDQIKKLSPNLHVVIMTAHGTSQTSIEAMRLGAFDYLNKPLDLDEVRSVVEKALADRALSRSTGGPAPDDWEAYTLVNLVGNAPRMREAYKRIGLLAANDVSALITGERGVGKEAVARTIHFSSPRKEMPFLALNCQSLAPDTAENEIFGHRGWLERANDGTLYVVEIQNLALSVQDRLAAILKNRRPEGAADQHLFSIRILAATTEDLGARTRQGQFSPELFDLLRVITIELPPLRERRDDIPELAHHFIRRNNIELRKSIKGIDEGALQLLAGHSWPGNVAELENAVKRACILARGEVITESDFGGGLDEDVLQAPQKLEDALDLAVRQSLQQMLLDREQNAPGSVFHELVGRIETTIVREALKITGGSQVKAAEILGLNRTTLRKKLTEPS